MSECHRLEAVKHFPPGPILRGKKSWDFPGGSDGKECASRAGDLGFNTWVRKIPWRRAWQPAPVFLAGESPWTEEPGGLQTLGSQRVGRD